MMQVASTTVLAGYLLRVASIPGTLGRMRYGAAKGTATTLGVAYDAQRIVPAYEPALLPRGLGFLVHALLRQLGEVGIRLLFFLERLLQQLRCVLHAQLLRQRACGSIGRNLVVFDRLRCPDDRGV